MMKPFLNSGSALLIAGALAACSGTEPADVNNAQANAVEALPADTATAAPDLPPGVAAVVEAAVPGMTIVEAERKEREERVYYDVEGTRPDGSEVELDLLQKGDTFEVVEIQRDIPWTDAPADVRAAAAKSAKAIEPVRVIESKQTDGSIVYELFAEGKPDKPSLEVQLKDGKAAVLTEEWPH